MLQLQRASAGSGKTYTLAKKFIEYYISQTDETGTRRLRPARALRESLQHILAITFTNKATNEMKLRIVEKLNSLASWTPNIPIDKVDYLKDFTKQFNSSPQEIASLCKYALKVLLTDYGDFKVSTIDSFFQTVLRTFAYEADLDDTYQLELDSNYVTQMGLDTTLDEIDTNDNTTQGSSWVENMMETKAASGKGWNIFQKSENKHGVYKEILNASRNLAKEDFKEIRESLDAYFEEHPDFYSTYNNLSKHYEKGLREAFIKMKTSARAVRDAFINAGLDMENTAGSYLASRIKKMAETWNWDTPVENITFKIPEFTRKGATTRVFHPKPKSPNPHLGTSVEDEIQALATTMYEDFDSWRKEASSDAMKRWRIYRTTMPYVGLLQSVRGNARLFLTDSNTVELGETNSILNRIIGNDDAPFVYERLGSRLEHFLIDEFQDTSNLQWRNMRPLLSESEGKGNDNLIIGDAKQSIYRFRNADPSLITTRVPQEFAATCRECGNTASENTNWRSSLRIVKFNNLFFRFFSKELGERMERLYSNTVQPASHKENTGFVKIQLFENETDEDNIPAHFDEIPELISDMLRRGYKMREIAVLVAT
ncbi:MAG: UvrD-helicase domain-containing protein, partial [Muribaculaceae bacterium]|nr:UvrD-helicase domain-containing protein [Muribaculaceae bacterium]